MNNQDPQQKTSYTRNLKRNVLISASAGCLTTVVAGLALIVGLLIDTRLGTSPKWTLILLLGSAPFTLVGVYLIVRRAMMKVREEGKRLKEEE